MRLLVTGGRRYDDAWTVVRTLDRALVRVEAQGGHLVVVHGAADGLDTLAARWAQWRAAEGRAVGAEAHPIERPHEDGFGRNARMVRRGADACLSFPGRNGTADCTRRAREAGIRVGVVDVRGVLSWG